MDLGLGDNGLSWEQNPAKHHTEAKKLAPAFSVKALKAKEPTMHRYIDDFVEKMKELGGREAGIELKTVSVPGKSPTTTNIDDTILTFIYLVDRLGSHGYFSRLGIWS